MKLSISNIAWNKEDDDEVLTFLCQNNYNAIEIAPTIILDNPYDNLDRIVEYRKNIKDKYHLDISSIQSIWYGKSGNIFNLEDRDELLSYTKKAILFASAIDCHNLVFGCPKNRNIPEGHKEDEVIDFFRCLGEYAKEHHTIIALEANPKIYNTNFLNKTIEAFNFARKIGSDGIKVNVDLGTIIENKESLDDIKNNIDLVNHVHISEPYLKEIEKRSIHKELIDLLKSLDYDKYLSIEMKNLDSLKKLEEIILYIKEI